MTVRVVDTYQEPHVSAVTRKNTVYEGAVVEVDDLNHTPHTRRYAAFVGPTVAVRPYRCTMTQRPINRAFNPAVPS